MRKTDWFLVLAIIISIFISMRFALLSIPQGNHNTMHQGNHSSPNYGEIGEYLCGLAAAKAWDVEWDDDPRVVTHSIYSNDGERVANILIIYKHNPEEEEVETEGND